MLPVLICQFYPTEGPGFFAQFLNEQSIAWQLIQLHNNESLPKNLDNYSALVMMGGPMSVNDHLPWISPLLELIRAAQAKERLILGHCLGGQLIAKALGAQVTSNPVREIGWGEVKPSHHPVAQQIFGSTRFNAFHWHGETFSLPEGAVHLLSSDYCHHQAFLIGKTLALQCHIEMTADMVRQWCIEDTDYHQQGLATSPAVQTSAVIQEQLDEKIEQLQKKARHIYLGWLSLL